MKLEDICLCFVLGIMVMVIFFVDGYLDFVLLILQLGFLFLQWGFTYLRYRNAIGGNNDGN